MLSGLGPELGAMLSDALNSEDKLHPVVDPIVVNMINKMCPFQMSLEEVVEDLLEQNRDIVDDDQHVILPKDVIDMFKEAVSENVQSLIKSILNSELFSKLSFA